MMKKNTAFSDQRSVVREFRSLLNIWFGPKPIHYPLSTIHSIKVNPGFTLIEMMVAVSIFAVVMMIGVGALLTLVEANKRAQAINSVMNNLNIAVESMSRSIRVGTTYHCEEGVAVPAPAVLATPQDCPSGNGTLIAFESSLGNPALPNDQVVYRYNSITKQIERSLDAGGSWIALTAPEVSIDDFEFFVIGTTIGNTLQPRVVIKVHGSANVPGGATSFTVQSSVVQRLLDI